MNLQRDVTLIMGRTGQGKTCHAIHRYRRESRALLLDADFEEFPALYFQSADSLLDWFQERDAYEKPGLPFRVAYTPLSDEWAGMMILARALGPLTLYIEEADRLDDPKIFPEYDEIITRGRHFGISITALGLHPAKLPKDLRRQCSYLACYNMTDPDDIDYLAYIVGESAYQIPALPPYHYLEWTPRAGSRLMPPLPHRP